MKWKVLCALLVTYIVGVVEIDTVLWPAISNTFSMWNIILSSSAGGGFDETIVVVTGNNSRHFRNAPVWR
jgi:hypothetical protein